MFGVPFSGWGCFNIGSGVQGALCETGHLLGPMANYAAVHCAPSGAERRLGALGYLPCGMMPCLFVRENCHDRNIG